MKPRYLVVASLKLVKVTPAKMIAAATPMTTVMLRNRPEMTVLEFAWKIKALTGSRSEIAFEPLPENDPMQRRPDISKAKRLLGWEPEVGLDERLERRSAGLARRWPSGRETSPCRAVLAALPIELISTSDDDHLFKRNKFRTAPSRCPGQSHLMSRTLTLRLRFPVPGSRLIPVPGRHRRSFRKFAGYRTLSLPDAWTYGQGVSGERRPMPDF